MISSLLLLALLQPTQRASADPCASVKPATTLRAVVLAVPATGRDSVVRATVCVVPPSGAAPKVGSYHGEPLYHASLAPEEYRSLLDAHGFEVVAHKSDDPDCGGHTIWLAQLRQ